MERLIESLRDDDPLPPSTVDIWQAVRAGRRRIRARWAGVGTVVLVVLAVVIPVLSQTATGGMPLEPANRPASAPGFDPLRKVISVGEVPGTTPYSYGTAKYWQQYTLTIGTSGAAQAIVYAPGWPATYLSGSVVQPETGTQAEPVAGRQAYWLNRTLDSDTGAMLAWEWTDGAWAFVQPQGPEETQPDKEMMHRIASAVRVDGGTQLAMPFTVPVPAGHHLVGTTTMTRPHNDPYVRTGLLFDTEDLGDPGRFATTQRGFNVAVENGWKMGQKAGTNEQVDGHEARVVDGQVQIFDVADGFAIDVQGAADKETLRAVARSVQLSKTPSDWSTWVTQPLR
ncbi:hypothetical protein JOF56_010083 [Kibdelosporangium banguiense]|uniref:Uncharacterized protein n=1 Tax=Kibdelosporangium banguiense TaxID=1365924 RepID=A0ABS4TZ56_9PSEU|nr:hypothetical protein [Kibdelosporangium banguiense]MBP2329698.1 hypothetical protein [Kibdelosporangium banguiense]